MEQLLWLYPYECFTSHVFCLNSMPLDRYPNLLAFAFIREPIDKVVSSYFYMRGRRETANDHPTRKMSLPDLIDSMMKSNDFNPFLLDTPQTDWVVGYKNADLDMVHDYLKRGYVHILPTERFDESMVVLEQILPKAFTDCSYSKKINVSDKPVDEQYLTASREAAEKLPWIEKDTQLHQLANGHLDHLIAANFNSNMDFANSLKRFKMRCKIECTCSKGDNQSQSLIRRISSRLSKLMIKFWEKI